MFSKKVFNKVTGDLGEDKAVKYLKKHGYKVICRNFKTNIGEIDIIAKYHKILVFVEVKTRTSDQFGLPREAVNSEKQRKIRMIATQYMKANRSLDSSARFDVIEILDGEVTHIIDCF